MARNAPRNAPRTQTPRTQTPRTHALRDIEVALRRVGSIGRSRDAGRLRADVAGVQLTNQAAAILSALAGSGPLRASALADAVDTDAPMVSRELRTLTALGYVTVTSDPTDGRARIVALTDEGGAVYSRFRSATDDIIATAFRDWDDDDLVTLRDLMARVVTDFATTRRADIG